MSAQMHAIHVLIADDDALLRDIAAATLENAGFTVQAVASGNAAVAACALRLPDIALVDVEMPDGNGYQTCASIRALPGGANVPIVMVTGHDDPASIDHAYDVGATDFVVKPINWALIVHRIRYVLRGARTLDALRFSERKNAALLEAIPDGIFLVDAKGVIGHCVSPIAGLADGAGSTGFGSRRLADLLPKFVQARAMECLSATLRGAPESFEFPLETAGSTTRHFECRYAPNDAGQVLAIIRDVTARKETEAHIHRLAYFDALTDLPNREWLGEYLSQSLAQARREDRSAAVLYVDLDQFKRINDTLGHETGDALLRMVAQRLTDALGRSSADEQVHGQLARVGGDEFIVVLTGRPTTQMRAAGCRTNSICPCRAVSARRLRVRGHAKHRYRDVSRTRQRCAKSPEECRWRDVRGEGERAQPVPCLYQRRECTRGEASVARDGTAARLRKFAARGVLPAEV